MDFEILFQPDKIQLFIGMLMTVCVVVVVAVLLDLWDGVYTAKTTGQHIHSHKLRVTIQKMSEYCRFVAIGFLIDCLGFFFSFYIFPFVVVVFGLGLIIVEIKSMFEHARKRKSTAASLPSVLSSIIAATNNQEAKEILNNIIKAINEENEPK